jgi:hypothetical protein
MVTGLLFQATGSDRMTCSLSVQKEVFHKELPIIQLEMFYPNGPIMATWFSEVAGTFGMLSVSQNY